MRPLHNIFGEDGEALTVLSLLGSRKAPPRELVLGEMGVSEAVDRLCELAARPGRFEVMLTLRRDAGSSGDEAFSRRIEVPVAEVCAALEQLAAEDGGTVVVVRRLSAEDERRFEADVDEAGAEGASGPVREALHGFVDSLRHLFNAAGEGGEPLTILSVLLRSGGRPAEERQLGSGMGAWPKT